MDNTLSHKWDFLAPQFVDFSKPVDDSFEEGGNPEEYFNFDHENNIPLDMMDETSNTTTTETQMSPGKNDNRNTEEPKLNNGNKVACDTESSDDGMSTLRITKPLFHLPSSCDSQDETATEDEYSSVQVHSVVPTPPVFSNGDIPSPPKTTDEEEGPASEETTDEEGKPSSSRTIGEDDRQSSIEEDSLEDTTPMETEDSSTEVSATEEPVSEAPTITLPVFNLGGVEKEVSPERQDSLDDEPASPPVQHAETVKPVELYRHVNLVTSWRTPSNPTDESTDEHAGPTESLVQKPHVPVNLVTSWNSSSDENTSNLSQQQSSEIKNKQTAPVKAHIPVNLVASWNTSCDTKPSTSKPTTQVKKPTQKRRGSESQLDTNHRITRSMTRPRRSIRVKPRRSNVNDTSSVRAHTPSSKRRRTDMNLTLNNKTIGAPKLTMPQTPTFLKRKMNFPTEKPKKTEELEMERINRLQKQMANTRKLAEESYKMLKGSTKYVPVRSQLPTTQPKEFEFRTDTRITRTSPAVSNTDADKDFFSNLRKHTEPQKKQNGPTKPQPFHFSSTQHKTNHEEGSSGIAKPYRSMAEQVAAFQVKTPERFQTWKRRQQNKGPVQQVLPNKLTCPKTPALETRKRKRVNTAVSARDKEDKEVEDMKSYKFKANPVNPRVMSNMNIGIKVAPHKEPTKPVGFSFHTSKRNQEREADRSKEEEKQAEFHARPIPARMLEGVTGLPDAKQIPLTCAKSPAFALKNRKRVQEIETKPDEETAVIKARPAPHVGVPFLPNLERKTTEIKAFSFATRDEATALKKEEKIQQVFKDEQKLREFKAQLMPILDTVSGVPVKKAKKSTAQKPFSLSHGDVGAKRADDWSKKMAEELEAERNQTFHAKEATVLHKKPFIPQKSDKPLTEINDFTLNSDKRAEQRHQYDAHKIMREHDLVLQKAEIERQDAIREQKEVEKMRADMVHKSNPIRQYKAIEIEPSDRPLTQPKTPNFSDRFKNRTIP